MPPIRCRTDFEKSVIVSNFEKRGWVQCVNDLEWNVYWAAVGSVKQWFNPDSGQRLGDDQIINHFPNHGELTRKDMMVKNIKRYRKEVEKEMALLEISGESAGSTDSLDELDFVPATYTLPADYSLFVEEFRRHPASTWIMKPARGAQGSGIFLINKLSQIKKWATGGRYPQGGAASSAHTYVVSRYIAEPLLVSNKKFDLRLYVLVTSYRPLKAYIHRNGFARFCTAEYSSDAQDMDNAYMHLTNVAIQKHGEDYNANHGGKWSMRNLMLYIESTMGAADADRLAASIDAVIIHSLRACQNVIINDRHCFELYGYDILIDAQLKPWLIEVNASPSLSTTTESDRVMKHEVIHDTLNIVCPSSSTVGNGTSTASILQQKGKANGPRGLGGFSMLYDEATAFDGIDDSSSGSGDGSGSTSRGTGGGGGAVGAAAALRRAATAARSAGRRGSTSSSGGPSGSAGGGTGMRRPGSARPTKSTSIGSGGRTGSGAPGRKGKDTV